MRIISLGQLGIEFSVKFNPDLKVKAGSLFIESKVIGTDDVIQNVLHIQKVAAINVINTGVFLVWKNPETDFLRRIKLYKNLHQKVAHKSVEEVHRRISYLVAPHHYNWVRSSTLYRIMSKTIHDQIILHSILDR